MSPLQFKVVAVMTLNATLMLQQNCRILAIIFFSIYVVSIKKVVNMYARKFTPQNHELPAAPDYFSFCVDVFLSVSTSFTGAYPYLRFSRLNIYRKHIHFAKQVFTVLVVRAKIDSNGKIIETARKCLSATIMQPIDAIHGQLLDLMHTMNSNLSCCEF